MSVTPRIPSENHGSDTCVGTSFEDRPRRRSALRRPNRSTRAYSVGTEALANPICDIRRSEIVDPIGSTRRRWSTRRIRVRTGGRVETRQRQLQSRFDEMGSAHAEKPNALIGTDIGA